MAKRKKASASPSYKKKSIATPDKKSEKKMQPKSSLKKNQPKLNVKKVEIISEKINKINKNFETLIQDCKEALIQLTENSLTVA